MTWSSMAQHPPVLLPLLLQKRKYKLQELMALAETARNDLGDKGIPCKNYREAGYIDE